MTLQSLDDTVQSAVGKKEHWRLFEGFQGSPLHLAIIAKLQSFLECEDIDSSKVGSEILRRIRSASPQLIEGYSEDITGGLFGMTLWNLLVEQQTHWRFVSKGSDVADNAAGTSYFRLHG